MADLAPAGPACPSRFSYAKWRKVVMQNEPLRLFAAAVGIQHLHFLTQRIDSLSASHLAFSVKRRHDPVARNAVSDIEQLLVHLEQLRFALGLAYHCCQFLLNPNHLARMPVRELERFDELVFR